MRIAQSIEILNEIKTDFYKDNYGNPTEDAYDYKEVLVKDINGDILEIFRVSPTLQTENEFFENTGLALGVSAYQ